MPEEATNPGASPEDQQQEQPKNPRDAILDAMDEKINAERQAEHQSYLDEMAIEQGVVTPDAVSPEPEPIPQEQQNGAASVEAMHTPQPPGELPAELQNDPLAEYIEMQEGVPMFKTVVDGASALIPLDRARAQLQKGVAAEVRMQQAAETQRQLEQREQNVRASEAALQERAQNLAQQQPLPDQAPPEDLIGEAKEIVSTLFTGNEDEAATKLAAVISRGRTPAQAPINTQEIVNQAAEKAKIEMTQEQLNRDASSGYAQFSEDFPDIMADANLYGMADRLTDEIAKEHPTLLPSQVMQEAGKRVRSWVTEMKGTSEANATPNNGADSGMSQRQERKRTLTPMPQPAAGAQQQVGEPEEPMPTPQDALREIREARGQPV